MLRGASIYEPTRLHYRGDVDALFCGFQRGLILRWARVNLTEKVAKVEENDDDDDDDDGWKVRLEDG